MHVWEMTTIDELLARCEKTDDGCMVWNGNKIGNVGVISIHGIKYYVNRLIMSIKLQKSIDSRTWVVRNCKTKYCCNPDHLMLSEQPLNLERKQRKEKMPHTPIAILKMMINARLTKAAALYARDGDSWERDKTLAEANVLQLYRDHITGVRSQPKPQVVKNRLSHSNEDQAMPVGENDHVEQPELETLNEEHHLGKEKTA